MGSGEASPGSPVCEEQETGQAHGQKAEYSRWEAVHSQYILLVHGFQFFKIPICYASGEQWLKSGILIMSHCYRKY